MKKIKRLIIKASLFFAVPSLCIVVNVEAASFDCKKATTKIEKMICADAELSKLDEKMAAAYKTAMQDVQQSNLIRQAQKQWLKGRNGCVDSTCVKQAYEMRLQDLTSLNEGKNAAQQDPISAKKPLYGHCVDLEYPAGNCGSRSGKGYTVCETYLKYLNTFDRMPKCEVVVPPNFQRPDWEEVDVMEHLDWAYQAEMRRFGRRGWWFKDNSDFATWQKKFLTEKEAGRIIPAMRKVRVKPLGKGKEITILAYTRNLEGCQGVIRQIAKGEFWAGVGYAHFLLPDIPGAKLVRIWGAWGSMYNQTEMLLYAGRPYFVREFDPAIVKTPSMSILAFTTAGGIVKPENNNYGVMDFCIFYSLNWRNREGWNKPEKSN